MLKRRIIPVQLLMGGRLVKTKQFDSWRDVGDPIKSSKVYCDQDADELIFLNIAREKRSIDDLLKILEKVTAVCFMPLSLGGGIRTLSDARRLIQNGADKVVVNSAAYSNPQLLSEIAAEFGTQAVIAGIDVRVQDGKPVCFAECGTQKHPVDLIAHCQTMVAHGAGEIMIQSIDHDGCMDGYDLGLIRSVVQTVKVPVIGAGGSGNYEHLRAAFTQTDCQALACGSIFNFSDSNPLRAKACLTNSGLPFKVI